VQRINRIPLIRCSKRILKPGGDALVQKNLFNGHRLVTKKSQQEACQTNRQSSFWVVRPIAVKSSASTRSVPALHPPRKPANPDGSPTFWHAGDLSSTYVKSFIPGRCVPEMGLRHFIFENDVVLPSRFSRAAHQVHSTQMRRMSRIESGPKMPFFRATLIARHNSARTSRY